MIHIACQRPGEVGFEHFFEKFASQPATDECGDALVRVLAAPDQGFGQQAQLAGGTEQRGSEQLTETRGHLLQAAGV
jgi:hypothetical protein